MLEKISPARLARKSLLGLSMCLLAVSVAAQEKPPVGTAGALSPEEKAMMEKMVELATPGPNHEALTSMEGDWTFTSRFWMKPGDPPAESTGRATFTPMLGGRFVEGKYTGDMMGMPFEGIAVMGYDNLSGKYQTSWIDNMGTMMMFMTGQKDPSTNSIVYTGQVDDFMKPGTKIDIRQVVWLDSQDGHRMEMFEKRDGQERKVMEIVYKREK